MEGDIVGPAPIRGWLIVGFFTPDYRPLATAFGENLKSLGHPHHLFARERVEGKWVAQTLQKPSIVLAAMDRYPDKTLILMDVDCVVRGDIGPVTALAENVALYWKRDNGPASQPSSRVVVLKPALAVRLMVERWKALCDQANANEVRGDELLLPTALKGVPISVLPLAYSGACFYSSPPGFVIVHRSEHEKGRFWRSWLYRFKAARRRLVERIAGMPYEQLRPRM